MAKTTAKAAESGNALLNGEGRYSTIAPGAGQLSPQASREHKITRDRDTGAIRPIPEHVEGKTNLPGLVIPVADLRAILPWIRRKTVTIKS